MRDGASKVTVDKGQVVKVTKDKNGIVKREVLTKAWTDWIDYWAVDFDFENRKEIVRVTEAEARNVRSGPGVTSSKTSGSLTEPARTERSN